MPWLVVLGSSNWAGRGFRFGPGKHLVSDEIAARARSAAERGIGSLLVMDEEPEIVIHGGKPGQPLSLDNVKRGMRSGVALAEDEPALAEIPEQEDYTVPLTYPCPFCEAKFPSEPPRQRHIEFHHDVGT